MATVVNPSRGRLRRGAALGIALSPASVTALVRGPGDARARPWRYSLTPLNGDGAGWPGLTDALRALSRDTGVSGGKLTVALMPPLVETRTVDVPPLAESELQQLLSRNAARYFVTARGPQVVGAQRSARKAARIAASASARLVNAIHVSALDAGWTVEAVIPAEASWSAATFSRGGRRGTAHILVAHPERTDMLRVENGRVTDLRRFRPGAADAALIADATSGGGTRVTIAGHADVRDDLARALRARNVPVELAREEIEGADEPDVLAAMYAGPRAEPQLLPDAVRAARALTARRIAIRIGAAAALLFIAAAAIEMWGVRRQLDAVRAQRAELAPQLSATLVGRTSVEVAYRQLAALAAAQRSAPHWSEVIAGITRSLPGEAYLTGFRGRGDSVAVEGLAASASRAWDALAKNPGLMEVRSTSQVQRVISQDGPAFEKFTIGARVVPAKIPSAPASATTSGGRQ
jgi:hypothetical protein